MFGDIVKVTPSSKVVGDMALMMVAKGLTPEQVLDPAARSPSPTRSSRCCAATSASRRAAGPALQKKVLKGAAAHRAARARAAAAADLAAREAEARRGAPPSRSTFDFELPDVSQGLRRLRRAPAPVRRRQRAADAGLLLRHGAGDEIFVEIERGKTLIVRLQAVGETDEEGRRASSSSSTASRGGSPQRAAARRMADDGRPRRRPDAGLGRPPSPSARGGAGHARRSPALDRGHEDGDRRLRRRRRGDRGLRRRRHQVDTKQLLMVVDGEGADEPASESSDES